MFDVPDAKRYDIPVNRLLELTADKPHRRIRRKDLYESASEVDESDDDDTVSELRRRLEAQLSGLLDLKFTNDQGTLSTDPQSDSNRNENLEGGAVPPSVDPPADHPGEEVFSFRLFRDESPSHKIVLARQGAYSDETSEGGLVSQRPRSYYIAGEPTIDVMRQYHMAALSTEQILQGSKGRRWGLEKAWKVTTVTIGPDSKSESLDRRMTTQVEANSAGKRKRPGKKRRIILRVREKARKEREEAAKKQSGEKEQHILEKKKRLNRQKKLKRREKAREEKQAAKKGNGDAAIVSKGSSPNSE